ncbi:MAG: 3-oxoacyl-[acyl-carrier-protein] synthase 3 [Litorilinea sp.]|nr:MAG: 3-oxoacyl-[acyl-carrier-protein] synthase 3 [Litorilinea sp.]
MVDGQHSSSELVNGQGHENGVPQSAPSRREMIIPEVGRQYAQIIGWGYKVPDKVITNRDLEQIVDTSDEWIRTRTGIEQRHVVTDPKETTASLAVAAARQALEVADVDPSKIDLIICATSSPEHIFPATASLVQDAIGAVNAGAFDLSAACSGFVYALSMARGHILAGDAEYVLVIGAETLSRIVDWTDRNTCVLFGDGAGAVLVAASDVPGGIVAAELGSDGSGADLLSVPAGGSAMPASLETVSSGSHYIKMDGKAVFRFATRVMADATRRVLERTGLTPDDVDLVIPHQANLRIVQNSVLKQLKIPEEKVFVNLQKYGNTSTASIPIALCEAIEAGKVKPGDNLVFVGFGAGLTWAACAVKWSVPVTRPEAGWWKATRRQASYQAAAARSMWRRAVRWVYHVWPTDPEGEIAPSREHGEAAVPLQRREE